MTRDRPQVQTQMKTNSTWTLIKTNKHMHTCVFHIDTNKDKKLHTYIVAYTHTHTLNLCEKMRQRESNLP